MKDIYSPLDIDEEWDNMAPMVDAPVMGGAEGATAVAVKPDEGTADMNAMMPAKEEATSTLPPVAESNAMSTDTMPATPPLVNEGLKEDTASQDAAFEVANADMGMNNMAANTDDKLNINEINPDATAAAPSAEMAMPSTDEMPKADTKEATATPVPVIDMNAATSEMKDSGDGGIKVGESFTPEEKPAEDRFEGMEAEEKEEAPKEEKPEDSKEEPAAAELPVTPADKEVSKFGSSSKNEMKFDMSEVNEAMDSSEKESDESDAGLMNSIDRYIGTLETSLSTKRDRHDKLVNDASKLQDEIDRDQARLDKATQARDIMK